MIINSILDNDLYKFTMQNAAIKHFPRAYVEYTFIDRNDRIYPPGFDKKLQAEVDHMGTLVPNLVHLAKFQEKTKHYIDPSYFVFLRGYRFNPSAIRIWQTETGRLRIVFRGLWFEKILWEVPLLAIVSELYFKVTTDFEITEGNIYHKETVEKATLKRKLISDNNLNVVDFSTRRRASVKNQFVAVNTLTPVLKGTSNVLLGILLDLPFMGTHAHEWFMFMAAKYGYKMANSMALGKWADTYSGDLGIALSDTFTTDIFLKSFDLFHAKLFDGTRHDSDDPYIFTDKIVRHYKDLNINSMHKSIVYSDSLNIPKAIDLSKYTKGKIGDGYGVGTNISNDIDDITPLNIVIKMTAARPFNGKWIPTIKLSDSKGKHTGSLEEIKLAKQILSIS